MNDVKTSALLDQLMEEAKRIGNCEDVTAERLLIAAIDIIDFWDYSKSSESGAMEAILKKHLGNIMEARRILCEYVSNEKTPSASSVDYMDKKLEEACTFVQDRDLGEVDAVILIHFILRDPTPIVAFIKKLAEEDVKIDTTGEDIVGNTAEDGAVSDENEESVDFFEDIKSLFKKDDEFDFGDDEFDTVLPFDGDIVRTPEYVRSEIAHLVYQTRDISEMLRTTVYGQDNAINTFATGYFQASLSAMTEKNRKRPRATFLFAGPPGVGKTFLAETVAACLKLPYRRFDMSEYSDKEANIEFCGSDKVYKNGKVGNVTSFVADNPTSVLLFDEIEKSHTNVIHLFLQILDGGRLRDNYTDEEVSFTNTIIIFTTNAGRQLYEDSESGNLSGISRKVIIKALRDDVNPDTKVPLFPAAICSRFASGNVVMFNHIGANHLRDIAKKEIERHAKNLENDTNIAFKIDDSVYTALLFAEGSAADARTIRSRAETFFNDELYELLRLIGSEKVKTGISDLEQICITLDTSSMPGNISGLFSSSEKCKVLIYGEDKTVSLCKKKVKNFEFIAVRDTEEAREALKKGNIDIALLDMKYGAQLSSLLNLNIEDVMSPGRELFAFLREQRNSLPVYLIENKDSTLTGEEKASYIRRGVRGTLYIDKGEDRFIKELDDIAYSLHQQESMLMLAKENKLVSFESSQSVSKNGKNAEIKLYDFKMSVAVDSEDAKSVLSEVSRPNVRFDDVIGAEDAKKELKYFVEYLKNPSKYIGTGVKPPKGVILYGPPGTGKTMLAKAMACEAGVTFIAAEGNQFLKKLVGEGSEQVHKLFKTARKYAPSILFIDEIDAIAKERRGGIASNGEETLTAFLTEMDGFSNDQTKPVFVLSATNFDVEPGSDKSLDPALMRRFDRRVYIDLPNKEERIKFLKMKIADNRALDISESQIDNIALRSTGMSLAQLDSAVELALRSAIREGSSVVNDDILEEAFETFNCGEAKKWDASQLERVARHESGHAFISWYCGEKPSYLTIVARGNHGGYMQQAGSEGKAIFTKDELLARIMTALGGRAAELVYYGEKDGVSTGAGGDLVSATETARRIVCAYGMDNDFGLAVDIGNEANGVMSADVRTAVNRILNEQMKEAVRLISENKNKIDALVDALMSKNHLNGQQIDKILSKSSGFFKK